jgi:acetyl-CoA carboxylase biotin carboxyl carrier protein
MDLRKVKKLIELVEESGIAELEVRNGDEAIRIAMPSSRESSTAGAGTPEVLRSIPVQPHPAAPSPGAGFTLAAPMAGTFYRAPSPESAPFVEVGQAVASGEVLCIIESMKMMHEIVAQEDGRVDDICVANGEPISTGDVLFRFS